MTKKKIRRVSNEQIRDEVRRLADEMAEANGRQRLLSREILIVKTRQEECPVYRGGRLNDPKWMLLLIGGAITILELVSWFR